MEFSYAPVHHAAQACKPVINYVPKVVDHLVGVTWLNASLGCVASAVVAAGLVWYFMKGKTVVSTAVTNAETTIQNAVAKI